ncbi:MAG TPA: hypothetical protein DD723_08035 [Candidatus Omnitrophica bacterium]|nr:MAG: hypothetical protein A2Z81_07990 [Omnitrophica WOR_2 bacterium GWA2_45_18]OGX18553.1 MAG: hypothetical protein A2Y04_05505 [Omnitrophica WOR_2 bacterium GWC2_45_7]HBR15475.1 hypothetical protein [Candidatus Omnitrophota bacterium]
MPIKNRTGLTLTELLVASVLMIVISIGVISVNLGINRLTNQNSVSTRMATELEAAMLAITKDASLAVGDATNFGIWTNQPVPSLNKDICFRQDVLNTSGNYSDDTYVCYSEIGRTIYRCANIASPSPSPCPVASRQLILNAVRDVEFTNADDFFGMTSWPAYMIFRLSTSIDVLSACNNTTNPCASLTTNISPTAHGK